MSKKLVIRVNNLQNAELNDDYDVTEEVVIRWDRVIMVSVATLLLLIGLVVGTWTVLNTTDSASEPAVWSEAGQPAPGAGIVETTETPVAAVATQTEHVELPEVENSPAATLDVAKPKVKEPKAAEVIASVPPTSEPNASELVTSEPVTSETRVDVSQDDTETVPAFVDPVEVKSNQIVNAQLTHNVSQNKPVERLGNVISMDGDTLIKVHFYTGLEGLKGETLYYDWYLSEKKMARVKVNVRSNKTSASSSKYIDQYMTGDWRVKVSTSKGHELALATFNVTP